MKLSQVHELFPILRDGPLELRCGITGCEFTVDSELKFVSHIQSKHRTESTFSANGDPKKCLVSTP